MSLSKEIFFARNGINHFRLLENECHNHMFISALRKYAVIKGEIVSGWTINYLHTYKVGNLHKAWPPLSHSNTKLRQHIL